MRKGDLIKLLNQYNSNRWFMAKENLRVTLLKLYLMRPSIEVLLESDDISFHEFNKFILYNFPDEDLTRLFTQDYLTGTKNSAKLFRAFIDAEKPIDMLEKKDSSEIIPRPKTAIKHNKESKIIPDKTRKFYQSELIFKTNVISYLQLKGKKLDSGVCCALTLIWYEYLNSGRDLIAELSKLAPDSRLIKKINLTQNKVSGIQITRFYPELTFKNIQKIISLYKKLRKAEEKNKKHRLSDNPKLEKYSNQKNTLFSNTRQDYAEGYMSLCEFSEVFEQSIPFRKFVDYLDKLKKQGCSEQGLHTIVITSLKSKYGHIVGWTYKNNQYVLFDSNVGEYYFNDFKKFQAYLCDYIHHFSGLFTRSDHKVLSVSDFYQNRMENKEAQKSLLKK